MDLGSNRVVSHDRIRPLSFGAKQEIHKAVFKHAETHGRNSLHADVVVATRFAIDACLDKLLGFLGGAHDSSQIGHGPEKT